MRINLRIGHLLITKNAVLFEGLPLQQLKADSQEQQDDMMSKVSTLSKISYFKNRNNSLSQMQQQRKSDAFTNFLESNPKPNTKMPLINNRKAMPLLDSKDGF